jgi:hypothetical protein
MTPTSRHHCHRFGACLGTPAAKARPAWRKSKWGGKSVARMQAVLLAVSYLNGLTWKNEVARSLLSKFVGIIKTDQCGFISTEAKDKELHFGRIWVGAALLLGLKGR